MENAVWAIVPLVIIPWVYKKLTNSQERKLRRYKKVFVNSRKRATYHTQKKGKVFTHSQKIKIHEKAGKRCEKTGKRLRLTKRIQSHQWYWTFMPVSWAEPDHIIPKSIGGPNKIWNGMNLLASVNRKKSGYITRDVLELMQKRKETLYLTDAEFKKLVKLDLLDRV